MASLSDTSFSNDPSILLMRMPSTDIASKEALGGRGDIVAMEMSVAAKFVAFGYEKGDTEIWSLNDQMCSPLRRIEIAKDGPVQALAWHPQHDNVLFVGAPNGVLHKIVLAKSWKSDELYTGTLVDDYIHCLGFERDGRRLAVACGHKVGYIANPIAFPVIAGKVDVHWLVAPPLSDVVDILNDVIPCDVAIKGDFIYVAHLGCLGIRVFSISGGQMVKRIPSDNDWRRDQVLYAGAKFSPNLKYVAMYHFGRQRVNWFCIQNGNLLASSRDFLSPRRRPCFKTMRMAFVDDETLISGSLEGVLMLWKPIEDFIPWSSREIQPGNTSAEYQHVAVGRNEAGDILHLTVDNRQTALQGPAVLLGVLGDIRILDSGVLLGTETNSIAPSVSTIGFKPRPLPDLPPRRARQGAKLQNADVPSHPSSSCTHSPVVQPETETPKPTGESSTLLEVTPASHRQETSGVDTKSTQPAPPAQSPHPALIATSAPNSAAPDSKQGLVTGGTHPPSAHANARTHVQNSASSHTYPPPPPAPLSLLAEIPGSSANANAAECCQNATAPIFGKASNVSMAPKKRTTEKSEDYFLRESRTAFNAFVGLFLQKNISSGRLTLGNLKSSKQQAPKRDDDLEYIVNLGSQTSTTSHTRFFTPDQGEPSGLAESLAKRLPELPADGVASKNPLTDLDVARKGDRTDSPAVLLVGDNSDAGIENHCATSTRDDKSSPVAKGSDEQSRIDIGLKLSDSGDPKESASYWGAPIGPVFDPISPISPTPFNPSSPLHSTPPLRPVTTANPKGQREHRQETSTSLNSIPALVMPSSNTTYHTVLDSAGQLLRVPVTVSMGQPQYEQS